MGASHHNHNGEWYQTACCKRHVPYCPKTMVFTNVHHTDSRRRPGAAARSQRCHDPSHSLAAALWPQCAEGLHTQEGEGGRVVGAEKKGQVATRHSKRRLEDATGAKMSGRVRWGDGWGKGSGAWRTEGRAWPRHTYAAVVDVCTTLQEDFQHTKVPTLTCKHNWCHTIRLQGTHPQARTCMA